MITNNAPVTNNTPKKQFANVHEAIAYVKSITTAVRTSRIVKPFGAPVTGMVNRYIVQKTNTGIKPVNTVGQTTNPGNQTTNPSTQTTNSGTQTTNTGTQTANKSTQAANTGIPPVQTTTVSKVS